MAEASPPLYKPAPRRRFILGDSFDPSPTETPASPDTADAPAIGATPSELSKRSQSIKNLTASALFGIYGPSAYDSAPGTPGATTRQSSTTNLLFGQSSPTSPQRALRGSDFFTSSDGSELPSRRARPLSTLSRRASLLRDGDAVQDSLFARIGKAVLLFLSGAGYGLIIAQLHDQSHIVPVRVPVERDTPGYLLFWGVAAVVLGSLLPWVDGLWEEYLWESGGEGASGEGTGGGEGAAVVVEEAVEVEDGVVGGGGGGGGRKGIAPVWNPAVRSIGAFVGIAYAIRKLPWQSTSQASLTLAFVNPVLWYLLDRTRTGFWLSAFVAVFGSMFLIGVNPDFVAVPSADGVAVLDRLRAAAAGGGLAGVQLVGATTWIASVLYVSCLCFGNFGRRLNGRTGGGL